MLPFKFLILVVNVLNFFDFVVNELVPSSDSAETVSELSRNLALISNQVVQQKEEFNDLKTNSLHRLEELFVHLATDTKRQKEQLEFMRKLMQGWKETAVDRQLDILDKIKCSRYLEETIMQLKTKLEQQEAVIEKQKEELKEQKNAVERLKVETEKHKSGADLLEASTTELQFWKELRVNETQEIETKFQSYVDENYKAYNKSIRELWEKLNAKPSTIYPPSTLNCQYANFTCSVFSGKCYCVFKQIIHNRFVASAVCAEKGMGLVVIETKREEDALNKMLSENFDRNDALYFWMSGTDEDAKQSGWYWDHDPQNMKMEYTNWCTGEPNNFGGGEHYILKSAPYLTPYYGCWMDFGHSVATHWTPYTICESKF